MEKFKISKELSKILTKDIKSDKEQTNFITIFEKSINKTINTIADAVKRTGNSRQTIIKKNNTFKKIFFNILKMDETILTPTVKSKLSQEIKNYVVENGYVELDSGVLTYQENKIIIRVNNPRS